MANGKRLTFIGGGNMAEALLRGILAAKRLAPEQVIVTDVRADRLAYLRDTYGIETSGSNAEAAEQADTVLLAVKPQVMTGALDDLRRVITERQLVISIAAGISTAAIAEAFLRPVRVVRVMPNTPALVLEGMSALARGNLATPEDLATARGLFEAVGKVVVVDEALMDAVTGLSGSGPAYVFLVIEALSDAGGEGGPPPGRRHHPGRPDGARSRQDGAGDGKAPGRAEGHGHLAGRDHHRRPARPGAGGRPGRPDQRGRGGHAPLAGTGQAMSAATVQGISPCL